MTELPLSASGGSALDVAVRLARMGGGIAREHFSLDKQVKYKGKSNLVTDVDLLCEKRIKELIGKEYPSHNILAEESGRSEGDSNYTWVIDPLDGTNNYAFGVPFFAVNVALMKGDDVVVGVSYDPMRDELFSAAKGKGAFLNGIPIHVCDKKRIEDSFVGCDMGYDDSGGSHMLQVLAALWPGVHCIRVMGSAVLGLAYVACGRLSLYMNRCLYPWDIATGVLLVREAGGEFTDWDGKQAGITSKAAVVSNGIVAGEFFESMRDAGLDV